MILDAREVFETKHGRPFTASAAVANAIDDIAVRQSVTIDAFLDQHGEKLDKMRLDALVNKHKGNRRFTVRQCRGGALATITRLA